MAAKLEYNKLVDKHISPWLQLARQDDPVYGSEGNLKADEESTRKRKLCDVFIGKKSYEVFEYSLKDLMLIERLSKTQGASDLAVMFVMLQTAIPACPIDELTNLTQSESQELMLMINNHASLQRLLYNSSTVH